jgi:hypothetical protein
VLFRSNVAFGDVWNKTKNLLEGEDIESAKAKTGNLEDIKKKAPEATKHVEGSASTDKGTQAPAAKEGDLDDAVSHAAEAKKHVEGSVSTEKGTKAPAAKTGNLEDIKKKAPEATKHVTMKESMYEGTEEETEEKEEEEVMVKEVSGSDNIEGTKAANGPWEDVNVPHAAEAKKHVHMGTESKAKVETEAKEETISEGVTLNGTFFAPINENWMEEEMVKEEEEEEEENDDWNKGDDEESDVDAEPADDEIASDIPSVDDEEDEDDVVVPSAPVAKAGPRLMVSQSTGEYFIVGGGPKPVPVPLEDKEMAKRNPAKYLESLMDRMDDEGNLDEYGDEHSVRTDVAVNSMPLKKKLD